MTATVTPSDTCPICYEPLGSYPVNPHIKNPVDSAKKVDHYFHLYCIAEHCKTSSLCPLCRDRIQIIQPTADQDFKKYIRYRMYDRAMTALQTGFVSQKEFENVFEDAVSDKNDELVTLLLAKQQIDLPLRSLAFYSAIKNGSLDIALKLKASGSIATSYYRSLAKVIKEHGYQSYFPEYSDGNSCSVL